MAKKTKPGMIPMQPKGMPQVPLMEDRHLGGTGEYGPPAKQKPAGQRKGTPTKKRVGKESFYRCGSLAASAKKGKR